MDKFKQMISTFTGKIKLAKLAGAFVVLIFMLLSAPETEGFVKGELIEYGGDASSKKVQAVQTPEAAKEQIAVVEQSGATVVTRDMNSARMKMKASKVKSGKYDRSSKRSTSRTSSQKAGAVQVGTEAESRDDLLKLVTNTEAPIDTEETEVVVENEMELAYRRVGFWEIGELIEESFVGLTETSRDVQRMVLDTIPEVEGRITPSVEIDRLFEINQEIDGSVSGNGTDSDKKEQEGETVEEVPVEVPVPQDVDCPQLAVDTEAFWVLGEKDDLVYCSNQPKISVKTWDEPTTPDSGIAEVYYAYGDKCIFVTEHLENATITLPEEFFGQVQIQCKDNTGNTSQTISGNYLAEQINPEVFFALDEECTAPYTLWVTVCDNGDIASGIREISYELNGQKTEIEDFSVLEMIQLSDSIEVPGKVCFPIQLEDPGEYELEVAVLDHAGNETVTKQQFTVEKPALVAVYMPEHFTIHIDPQQLKGREQIYSDDVVLKNVSDCDVRVKIDEINLYVNDEVSDTGVVKDCEIYMIAPDTGEKILLQKGKNTSIYSYKLPMEAVGDIAAIRFVGSITEDSDELWVGSDLAIDLKVSFEKWRE